MYLLLHHAKYLCWIQLSACLAFICLLSSCLSSDDAEITWYQHIAPLVSKKCISCHITDGIGPFSVATYEEVKSWAPLMEHHILSGDMPPWGALETDECSPLLKFNDDLRLSDREKKLFTRWIDEGLLKGDAESSAPIPASPKLELTDPDIQLTIPSSVTVGGDRDQYVCFVLDPGLTEKVWLTELQITPGNNAIAHHAQIFLDENNSSKRLAGDNGQYKCFGGSRVRAAPLIGIWAPGAVPTVTPNDSGTPIEPGSRLIIQMHYHPTSKGVEVDSTTRLDLKWTTKEPRLISRLVTLGNLDIENYRAAGGEGFGLTTGPGFEIPAGASNHVESNRILVPGREIELVKDSSIRIYSVGTHMHHAGTDMKLSIERRDNGGEECLLQTPKWNYGRQRLYSYKGKFNDFPAVYPGDIINLRCTYNNSLTNPAIVKALEHQGLTEPQDISLGDETLDEMCVGVYGVVIPLLLDGHFDFLL